MPSLMTRVDGALVVVYGLDHVVPGQGRGAAGHPLQSRSARSPSEPLGLPRALSTAVLSPSMWMGSAIFPGQVGPAV